MSFIILYSFFASKGNFIDIIHASHYKKELVLHYIVPLRSFSHKFPLKEGESQYTKDHVFHNILFKALSY